MQRLDLEEEKILSRTIAAAWQDANVYQQLWEQPAAVLAAQGLNLGDTSIAVLPSPDRSFSVRIIGNLLEILLPPAPTAVEDFALDYRYEVELRFCFQVCST